MTWEMFGRWVFAAIIKYVNIHTTKSKETFLNIVYLLLFNTLFVYGIYQCKAELFLFKMISHLQ